MGRRSDVNEYVVIGGHNDGRHIKLDKPLEHLMLDRIEPFNAFPSEEPSNTTFTVDEYKLCHIYGHPVYIQCGMSMDEAILNLIESYGT